MLVNFDDDPRNSLIYTAGIILDYFKNKNNSRKLEEVFRYCKKRNMEYYIFILSIDWLFLVGKIKEITNENEVVFCD